MRLWQGYLLSSLCGMGVGILLLFYPEPTTLWVIRVLGCIFLIPGIISIIAYFANLHSLKRNTSFPLLGLGSSLFGIILTAVPSFFLSFLMYILAIFLIIVAANQMIYLRNFQRLKHIGLFYFIEPILVLLAAIFIFINPIESASFPLTLLGIASIVYGISELWNTIYFSKYRNKMNNQQKDVYIESLSEDSK